MVYVLGLSLVVGVLVLTVQSTASEITATVDIHPKTLNLMSTGTWITVYIELPEDYNVSNIDILTVKLNYIQVELYPTEVGDYDNDGFLDLMVKFDRQRVISLFYHMELPFSKEVELTIKGKLIDGTPFWGSDTIIVIYHG